MMQQPPDGKGHSVTPTLMQFITLTVSFFSFMSSDVRYDCG